MKKLLQINTVVNYGSTGRIAEEIGIAAMNASWESFIAYGRYPRESKSQLIKIGNEFDQKMHGLQTRLFDRHGLGSRKVTKNLINKIKEIQPDVIHLHNLHGYYLNIELLFNFLKTSDIPIIWTLHDCWAITGHCVHFSYVKCDKWETKCFNCPQKNEYPASNFLDRSRNNYQLKKELFSSLKNLTIVPVSEWLGDVLKESFLKDYPIQVIPNGIDTEVFTPISSNKFRDSHQLKEKTILLGVANIWTDRKGLQDYIALSNMLDDSYQIVLVGVDKKQTHQIPKKIIAIERTESINELIELYSTADIVLNLSYEESFGLTTVEGFACGTPCIAYDATANPELIDTATGMVVEPGDLQALKTAINLVQSKGKAAYTEACIQRAHRFYRKEDRYKEYLELYDQM